MNGWGLSKIHKRPRNPSGKKTPLFKVTVFLEETIKWLQAIAQQLQWDAKAPQRDEATRIITKETKSSLVDMQHENKVCHVITEICGRNTRRLEETTNRLLMTIKTWTHKRTKRYKELQKNRLKWPQRGTQDQKETWKNYKVMQEEPRKVASIHRERRDDGETKQRADASLDARCLTKPLFSYGVFFSYIHFRSCLWTLKYV